MLYSNSFPLEHYYSNNKIETLLKYDKYGIYYKSMLIPYRDMKVTTGKKNNLILVSNRILEPVVLGVLDL